MDKKYFRSSPLFRAHARTSLEKILRARWCGCVGDEERGGERTRTHYDGCDLPSPISLLSLPTIPLRSAMQRKEVATGSQLRRDGQISSFLLGVLSLVSTLSKCDRRSLYGLQCDDRTVDGQ